MNLFVKVPIRYLNNYYMKKLNELLFSMDLLQQEFKFQESKRPDRKTIIAY